MFTKKQLEEIRRGLALLGVKDTDFPTADNLTGAELVAIVQNGENKTISVGELFHDYLEDMLDYAARGLSADEIAQAHGYADLEAWLTAIIGTIAPALDIDNNFEGGIYRLASAEEAKTLKRALDALEDDVLTTDDVINSLTSNDRTRPLSAAMGKYLMELISNISPSGSSVDVVDNLDSTSTSKALSANQGRVLKEMVGTLLNVNNGFTHIYDWNEFKDIGQAMSDSTTLAVNALTVYNLKAQLDALKAKVAAMSGQSVVPGTDPEDGTTYILKIESDNNVLEIDAAGETQLRAWYETWVEGVRVSRVEVTDSTNPAITWYTDNASAATVINGKVTGCNILTSKQDVNISASYGGVSSAQYHIIVRKVGGDGQSAAEPYITASPDTVTVSNDGKFELSSNLYQDYIDIAINVNNSTDTWKLSDVQNYTWFRAEKYGDVLRLSNADEAISYDTARVANVAVCLVNSPDVTLNIPVSQQPVGYENIDFRIFTFGTDSTSHVCPKFGDDYLLVVQAPKQWRFDTIPSWVSLSKYIMGSDTITPIGDNFVGNAGETVLRVKVGSCTESRAMAPIRAILTDGTETALYFISQDASLSNTIKLVDTDGMRMACYSHVSYSGYALILYASSDWTITLPTDQNWVKFRTPFSGSTYTISEDGHKIQGSATSEDGMKVYLTVSSYYNVWGRWVYARATLDNGLGKTWCNITQFGTEEGNYIAGFVYDEPIGPSGGYARLVCYRLSKGEPVATPTWYVYIDYDKYGYTLPDGITFLEGVKTSTSTAGYTTAWCKYNKNDGLLVRIEPLAEGEESRDISVRVCLAEGLLPNGYVLATIHQEAASESSHGSGSGSGSGSGQGGDVPDTTPVNTLSANIGGSSNVTVSASTTSATVSVLSTADWTATVEGNGNPSLDIDDSHDAGKNADIHVTFGENTSTTSSRTFTVTITSEDENCTPSRVKTLTITQSAAVSYYAPDSIVIGSAAYADTTMYIQSSTPWRLAQKTGSGLYTGYTIITTSGNATNGLNVTVRSSDMTYTTNQTGAIVMSQQVNGQYVQVAEIAVTKEGISQVSSINVSTTSISIGPDGNTSSPSVVDVAVSPSGSSWHSAVIGGASSTLTRVDNTSTNKLNISTGSYGSGRTWTVRVYLDGTNEYKDITVSQAAASLTATYSHGVFPAAETGAAMNGSIAVSSNGAWTATVPASVDWITFTTSTGSGTNGTAAFTVFTNSVSEPRSAVITIKANANSSVKKEFTVYQVAGAPAVPVLTQDGNQVTISPNGEQNATIYYKTSLNGTTYGSEQLYSGAISISEDIYIIARSEKYDIPSPWSDALHAEYDSGSSIPAQQSLVIDKHSISVGANGASFIITVEGNVVWSATASSGVILSGDTDNVLGDGSITVTYPANDSTDTVYRWVKVSADDANANIEDQICTITQSGITVVNIDVEDQLGNDVESLVFGALDITKKIYITCNTTWSVSSTAAWASLSPANGPSNSRTEVTVTKTSNSSTAGTLVITGLGNTRKIVFISQNDSYIE